MFAFRTGWRKIASRHRHHLRAFFLLESGHRFSGLEISILLRIALPVFENGLVLKALETAWRVIPNSLAIDANESSLSLSSYFMYSMSWARSVFM